MDTNSVENERGTIIVHEFTHITLNTYDPENVRFRRSYEAISQAVADEVFKSPQEISYVWQFFVNCAAGTAPSGACDP